MTFFGLGGGVPVTPFGAWSYDLTEEEAGGLLASCPEGCVLVSHSPPKGAVDVSSRGQSLGSVAVRRCVERARPALVVCGHIHRADLAERDGLLYCNDGDWVESCTALVEDQAGELSLLTWRPAVTALAA